jgi:hypothetical protein
LLLPLNIILLFLSEKSFLLYLILLILQILFYILGYAGKQLAEKNIKNKYLYIPFYFLFMNVSVIKGIMYLKKKKGSGVWENAKRADQEK